MLDDDVEIDGAAEQRLQRAVIRAAIDPAEHLVGQVLQPRHEGDAEQGAQTEQMLGGTMRVRRMLADSQCAVGVQNAGEHIARFTWRTGDCLCGVDAVLVGGVGIEGERSAIIAEVARIEAAQQAVTFDGEALAVGG